MSDTWNGLTHEQLVWLNDPANVASLTDPYGTGPVKQWTPDDPVRTVGTTTPTDPYPSGQFGWETPQNYADRQQRNLENISGWQTLSPDITGVTPGAGSAGGTKPAADQSGARSARALIKGTLLDYGFSEDEAEQLAGWAFGLLTNDTSEAEVLLEMRKHPIFKRKFPEIEARQKAGLAPLNPGEIVTYRRQARQMFRAAGLPEGFYDGDEDYFNFISKDISLAELGRRVEDGFVAASQAPLEVREELARMYGVNHGQLAAYFLDPDKAESLITRNFTAARIGGAARYTGYGMLDRLQAESLAGFGVTDREAVEGFSTLGEQRELFDPLVGQEAAEDSISMDEQLSAAFTGNSFARERIKNRAKRRRSPFDQGGGFQQTREGFGGLGTAT